MTPMERLRLRSEAKRQRPVSPDVPAAYSGPPSDWTDENIEQDTSNTEGKS